MTRRRADPRPAVAGVNLDQHPPKAPSANLSKLNMVKPLTFKGDKKSKKRKAAPADIGDKVEDGEVGIESQASPEHNASIEADEDDSWVSAEAATDVTGPIIVALSSKTPMCMACDANGKVFSSELENIVEGDTATAEPHYVRQVWIANRVAGTEEISLKGHHGRSVSLCEIRIAILLIFVSYLSCDKFGLLSATREAISPEESFLCIASPEAPGKFSIQTVRENFLTIDETSKGANIRGDAECVSSPTTFRIRMQARFKPKLKKDKELKTKEKISKKELEEAAGRSLDENEVRRLKKARVQGDYHEAMLDLRSKGKHDKYS